MPRIAVIEDLKRRSMVLPDDLRERVIELVSKMLSQREEVLLGIVFGGILVSGKPIRDIDVAVYTGYRVPPEELPEYIDELRSVLEKAVAGETGILKHVDVVVLEYAPPRLKAEILRRGRVVVNRSPGLRALLLLHALDEVESLERLEKLRENC